jgi:hypothetical protein
MMSLQALKLLPIIRMLLRSRSLSLGNHSPSIVCILPNIGTSILWVPIICFPQQLTNCLHSSLSLPLGLSSSPLCSYHHEFPPAPKEANTEGGGIFSAPFSNPCHRFVTLWKEKMFFMDRP